MNNGEYIPYRDFVDLGKDLAPNEQIHVNHENCSAGEDTKQRLYIKRSDDGGILLAYCHNCSLSGCYSSDDFGTSRSSSRNRGGGKNAVNTRKASKTHVLPTDGCTDASKWTGQHRTWVGKYGITQAELDKYKIMSSDLHNTVILPILRGGKLLGYQERTFNLTYPDGKPVPKYLTVANKRPLWWYSGDYLPVITAVNTTIIVEDVLSGIKCARFAPTIALLGASLGDELTAFIVQLRDNASSIILFLDDDNRQVRMAQLKIKAKLEQIGLDVRVITGVHKDPKECSDSTLREILKL